MAKFVETPQNQMTLRELPIGARLLIRSKKDWRAAVVSSTGEGKATLIVCSASGKTYRLRRALETLLIFDGEIPILPNGCQDDWRDELIKYDARW